jgi:hypothetical protein
MPRLYPGGRSQPSQANLRCRGLPPAPVPSAATDSSGWSTLGRRCRSVKGLGRVEARAGRAKEPPRVRSGGGAEANPARSARSANRSGPSTTGRARSMLGSRRDGTTSTPSMTTLPQGNLEPLDGRDRHHHLRVGQDLGGSSASNDTARRVGQGGSGPRRPAHLGHSRLGVTLEVTPTRTARPTGKRSAGQRRPSGNPTPETP